MRILSITLLTITMIGLGSTTQSQNSGGNPDYVF